MLNAAAAGRRRDETPRRLRRGKSGRKRWTIKTHKRMLRVLLTIGAKKIMPKQSTPLSFYLFCFIAMTSPRQLFWSDIFTVFLQFTTDVVVTCGVPSPNPILFPPPSRHGPSCQLLPFSLISVSVSASLRIGFADSFHDGGWGPWKTNPRSASLKEKFPSSHSSTTDRENKWNADFKQQLDLPLHKTCAFFGCHVYIYAFRWANSRGRRRKIS